MCCRVGRSMGKRWSRPLYIIWHSVIPPPPPKEISLSFFLSLLSTCLPFVWEFGAVKGGVDWRIQGNSLYVSFWTTARKRMDLINGSQRLNLYMVSVRETDRSSLHASVSRMLHAREYFGRVVRNRIIPDWPRIRPRERHVIASCYTPFKRLYSKTSRVMIYNITSHSPYTIQGVLPRILD